jgi:LacI family transcriptional regulator
MGTQGMDEYVYEMILNEKKADAVILINGSLHGKKDILRRYKEAGIHLVYVEGRDEWGHRVHYDNQRDADMAVKHLVDSGRKRIGLLIGNYEWVESMKERHDGFKKAMQAYGGRLEKESVFSFIEDFGDAVKNSLYHFIENKINAVYVGTGDEDAIKMINEAKKMGLRVPEDIAIVGQDDIRIAAVAGLTTIRQPITEMGQKSVEMAVSAIEQKEMKKMRDEIFYPELIIRKTT